MSILPTWRFAALAAALAVVLTLVSNGAVLVLVLGNLALLAVAGVDVARTTRPERLAVTREAPKVVGLFGRDVVAWEVRNPSGRATRVRLADALPPSLAAETRRPSLVLPAGGAARAETTIRPWRRGRVDLAEVVVRVEGPWRLMARQKPRGLPATIRVHPPFRSRAEAELRITRQRILEVGLRSARGRGGGTEFDQLREYTPDDEHRRVDWAASARAQRVIVRTYRAERNQTVLVLLDHGRTMAGRLRPRAGGPKTDLRARRLDARSLEGDLPRLDHALDAVLALTLVATRLGDRAGLVTYADRVTSALQPSAARGQLVRVTEAIYALEPELVESDPRDAFVETLSRFRRRSLIVVLTELAHAAIGATLLPALPLVARDHAVIVGAVADPQVVAWARGTPAEPGAAYRKAAAVEALEQRRRTAAALAARGAIVVDAQPRDLPGRLADAYLDLKATGRL